MRKRTFYVVVSGPTVNDKRICNSYVDAQELLVYFIGSTLETFGSQLEAEMFALYGCTNHEQVLDFVWHSLPINSSLWRQLFLDSDKHNSAQ